MLIYITKRQNVGGYITCDCFSYCWYTSDFIADIRLLELILDAMKTSLLSWQGDKNKCSKRSIRPCNKSPQHTYLCPKSHMWNTSVERTFSLKDGHDIMNLYDIPVKCTEATYDNTHVINCPCNF